MARKRQESEWDKWASMMAFMQMMVTGKKISPAKYHPMRCKNVKEKPINFNIPEKTALAFASLLNEGERAFGR